MRKRYYVVVETAHEFDQLALHGMATWIEGAMQAEADGPIDITVYEELDGLVADEEEN